MTFRFRRSHTRTAQKTYWIARTVFFLFLMIMASLLSCTPAALPARIEIATATEASTTAQAIQQEIVSPTPLPPSATFTATERADPSSTSLVFIAEADARVREARPTENYGNRITLQVDGTSSSDFESFLRFTATGVQSPVQSAILRVYVNDNATENGPAVYATDPAWTESEITWDNRPQWTGEATDNKGSLAPNSWAEYDVTPLVSGSGMISFVLVADSNDGVVFSSREGDQPPQLVITLGGGGNNAPTTTPTALPIPSVANPSGDVVLVGAGDISDCDNDNDELTAQLLDRIPGTVFTTGDNVYQRGSADEYDSCYDPTWGRHKDRTKPVPGNHEYRTEGAAGYFQYFDNIPPYYAYDLGGWRIYALNSDVDVSAGSEQILWLQADLLANPSQCVLAYWHEPRWSSGERHGSDEDIQPLWQILYEAGAELVINGHEHNYERFAEMDANGASVSPGLREIVAGTGGKSLYNFDTVLSASEVRDSSSFGVLKITLREDGYDWEFVPAEGSTFTDSGSSACH